ncbi:hypothetical protein JYT97_02885 [Haliea sp. AH-315-K21]|nr:hypothetical protein [Haliea sp. AH-315-K21]
MKNIFPLFLALLLASCSTYQANYANYDWLTLSTPRFTIYSQLDEEDTFEWAQDFDLFLSVIQQVIRIDERLLPPLDIVLFERERDFQFYRPGYEEGTRENVLAFFSNMDSWSIIGVPARTNRGNPQQVTYHEAVHWYSSSVIANQPLWFAEGLAEVYSTLEIDQNELAWGSRIYNHIRNLQIEGLYFSSEFLNLSNEDALNVNNFYSQSWLLVHYLLFGNNQLSADALNNLLIEIQNTDIETAIEQVLGLDYESLDRELKQYLTDGSYRLGQGTVNRADFSSNISPSTDTEIEFVLAKLAFSSGNLEQAHLHASNLAMLAPSEASTYDIISLVSFAREDRPTLNVALNNAIALNSIDSTTYQLQAELIWQDNVLESETFLDENSARQIVDLYTRSITLLPYGLDNYKNLIRVLSQVKTTTDIDKQLLEIGSAIFPNEGIFIMGRAIIEHSNGNIESALDLLDQSIGTSTDSEDRDFRTYLRSYWQI